jgi:hypothetical protein
MFNNSYTIIKMVAKHNSTDFAPSPQRSKMLPGMHLCMLNNQNEPPHT